jgi:hypothetical protein
MGKCVNPDFHPHQPLTAVSHSFSTTIRVSYIQCTRLLSHNFQQRSLRLMPLKPVWKGRGFTVFGEKRYPVPIACPERSASKGPRQGGHKKAA